MRDIVEPYTNGSMRLEAVDGKYRRFLHEKEARVDHSWLLVESSRPRWVPVILDVYAIARLPMVVIAETSLAYERGPMRDDIDTEVLNELFRGFASKVRPDKVLCDTLAGRDPCEPREVHSNAVVREAVTESSTAADAAAPAHARTRHRGVSQIAIAQDDASYPTLIALASDGTLWSKRNGFDGDTWKEIPGLPPRLPIKRAP